MTIIFLLLLGACLVMHLFMILGHKHAEKNINQPLRMITMITESILLRPTDIRHMNTAINQAVIKNYGK